MGLVTKSTFTKSSPEIWENAEVFEWHPQINRWYAVPSRRRWFILVSLYAELFLGRSIVLKKAGVLYLPLLLWAALSLGS